MNIKEIVNKIKIDEFGRPSGLLAMYKPDNITSHDLVDQVRRFYKFKKVGHAGALDRFAKGLMFILVGKATKLSDKLLNMDKEYEARILFGVSTDTQDIEGRTLKSDMQSHLSKEDITKAVQKFKGKYNQFVSVYSSVKVDGQKLRVLMRDDRYKKEIILDKDLKKIVLTPIDNKDLSAFDVNVPSREITIFEISVLDIGEISLDKYKVENIEDKNVLSHKFVYADIRVKSSKGTYIRQLAEDIGDLLGVPAMLVELKRTKVSNIDLDDAITIDELDTL